MRYINRLKKLQSTLFQFSCDALLVQDPTDLFYLTGLTLSSGKLLAHQKGAHLLVDHRYLELCQKTSPFPVLEAENPSFENRLSSSDFDFIHTLAFDSEKTSYQAFLGLQNSALKVGGISSGRHQLELIPIANPLKTLRAIKDEEEITILQKAAALGSQGFDFVVSRLKEGVRELDLAIALEIFWKERGGRQVAFEPIIAFGANCSMPHHKSGTQKLKKGDPVLIDIGVTFCHYHSDMTRMVFFGQPDPIIASICSIACQAQKAALSLCRPGVAIGSLDAAARNVIASNGYGECFTHSLGHGVGLEIHEFPTIKNVPLQKETPLASGMVITIEPGIYLPQIGGVRIEDTIVITENGYESLTKRNRDPILI